MDTQTPAPVTKRSGKPLKRLLAFLGVTLLCLLIVLLGVIWVLEKGPSPTVTETFCRSVRETSALKWVPRLFLSEEEIERYKSVSTEEEETAAVNTSLIHMAELPPAEENNPEVAKKLPANRLNLMLSSVSTARTLRTGSWAREWTDLTS